MRSLARATRRFARAALLGCAGCAGAGAAPLAPEHGPAAPPAVAAPGAATAAASDTPDELRAAVDAMLERVASSRRLAPRAAVRVRTMQREEVTRELKEKTEREIPRAVLEAQGELLRALGLMAEDYDYVEGIYALIEAQVAGFYDADERTMFLIDDLPRAAVDETLAHELVHALQDQHFDLATKLKYRAGDSDAVGALHALAEGDAMSAMFDVMGVDAQAVSPRRLGLAMAASVALGEGGKPTPRILLGALVAPYADGFAFVRALRDLDDWPAVDHAWRERPPASSEQLLHPEKYLANERPAAVDPPSLVALGAGWRIVDHDVLGEQGLRLALEQWTHRAEAAQAATGWGGDHYVVGERALAGGEREVAVALTMRCDTPDDAAELATVLARTAPGGCRERPRLGPFAWHREARSVAIVAGPLRRDATGALAPSPHTCATARASAERVLKDRPVEPR